MEKREAELTFGFRHVIPWWRTAKQRKGCILLVDFGSFFRGFTLLTFLLDNSPDCGFRRHLRVKFK